jgi:hypothetical protein
MKAEVVAGTASEDRKGREGGGRKTSARQGECFSLVVLGLLVVSVVLRGIRRKCVWHCHSPRRCRGGVREGSLGYSRAVHHGTRSDSDSQRQEPRTKHVTRTKSSGNWKKGDKTRQNEQMEQMEQKNGKKSRDFRHACLRLHSWVRAAPTIFAPVPG